jgi:hypothetical protein
VLPADCIASVEEPPIPRARAIVGVVTGQNALLSPLLSKSMMEGPEFEF